MTDRGRPGDMESSRERERRTMLAGTAIPSVTSGTFSGSKWDVCPSETEIVETVTWNGDEAVEVVAMGSRVEALQLESLVVVVPHRV